MMNNMQILQATKRKQENLHSETLNNAVDTEAFNSKKQRLSYSQYVMNDDPGHFDPNTQTNGYSPAGNGHLPKGYGHLQVENEHSQVNNVMSIGEMTNGENRVSEPMECADEEYNHNAEINGNLSTSEGKYCSHGHLNTCTTYNVPCRYPRMYCHPGGLLEDRLATYHGF